MPGSKGLRARFSCRLARLLLASVASQHARALRIISCILVVFPDGQLSITLLLQCHFPAEPEDGGSRSGSVASKKTSCNATRFLSQYRWRIILGQSRPRKAAARDWRSGLSSSLLATFVLQKSQAIPSGDPRYFLESVSPKT